MTTINQYNIARELGVLDGIDPYSELRFRTEFLKNYLLQSGARGFVLGVSGGQDSLLAGYIAQKACEELRGEQYTTYFHSVELPYGVQRDFQDVRDAIEFISPDTHTLVNIKNAVDTFSADLCLKDFDKGNVKARVRAVMQYAIAGRENLLVIGTDHAAEAVTGFFTKFGDGAADVLPLSGLTKRQGRSILEFVGAPEHLYLKTPTADLLDNNPGRADEDELGVTYEQIDDYLEGLPVSSQISGRIEHLYEKTMHKRNPPVTPHDTWWNPFSIVHPYK